MSGSRAPRIPPRISDDVRCERRPDAYQDFEDEESGLRHAIRLTLRTAIAPSTLGSGMLSLNLSEPIRRLSVRRT